MKLKTHLEETRIEKLFSTLCERQRSSKDQSHRSIVQQAKSRIQSNASDQTAINLVAVNDLRRQHPDKTMQLLQQSSPHWQQDSDSSQIAGYACMVSQELDQARDHLDRSVRLDPHRVDCWTLLGHLSEAQGQESQAISYYERAIVLDDTSFESAIALSRLHARRRRLPDAIHTLRVCLLRNQRASHLNLALAKLLQRRAAVLKRQRKYLRRERLLQEALDCFKRANAADPKIGSLIAQGQLQQRLNQHSDAKASFAAAVQRDPTSSAAITMLAVAHVDCGELPAALSCFRSSLEIAPDDAFTHFRFSRAQKFKSDSESQQYISRLQKIIATTGLKQTDHVLLQFALAKVLEDTCRYDEAWTHYDQANRLKSEIKARRKENRKRPNPKECKQVGGRVGQLTEMFSQQFFQEFASVGNPSETPIFIVGMPRSGTTLTEQILSSHPSVAGAGELHLIEHVHQDLVQAAPGGRMNELSAEAFRKSAGLYLKHLDTYRTDELHVTDKMPTNFMHLGLIATLFPHARIVHCRRNPMDIFVSSYCQNLNVPFCDLQQLTNYYRNYRQLMQHWQRVLPIEIHTIDYEAMVADPAKHSRGLIEYCGLEWQEQCLEFHKNDRAVHTPSKWQVRQPMYKTSVEKWRRYEKHLRPIADEVAAICAEFDN